MEDLLSTDMGPCAEPIWTPRGRLIGETRPNRGDLVKFRPALLHSSRRSARLRETLRSRDSPSVRCLMTTSQPPPQWPWYDPAVHRQCIRLVAPVVCATVPAS